MLEANREQNTCLSSRTSNERKLERNQPDTSVCSDEEFKEGNRLRPPPGLLHLSSRLMAWVCPTVRAFTRSLTTLGQLGWKKNLKMTSRHALGHTCSQGLLWLTTRPCSWGSHTHPAAHIKQGKVQTHSWQLRAASGAATGQYMAY